MARTLGDVTEDILRSLGREGDPDATQMAYRAVNIAVEVACLAFDIPEMHQKGTLTLYAGESEKSLTSLTGLVDIISVFNTTDGVPMGFVPFELLRTIVPAGSVTRFYSRDGNALLVRPTPTKTTTLEIRYSKYPSGLTAPEQSLPFEGHDGYVLSVATAICWACYEEVDSATLWAKIGEALGGVYSKTEAKRKVIEGIASIKEDIAKLREGGQNVYNT
ncbi:MAG: hypothetical protein K6T27_09945 [Thermoleophilum sp.]|nr:hypothetical protein [Thermoleophilum sp.]